MSTTPVYTVTAEVLNEFERAVRKRESARGKVERALAALYDARCDEAKAVEALEEATAMLRRNSQPESG